MLHSIPGSRVLMVHAPLGVGGTGSSQPARDTRATGRKQSRERRIGRSWVVLPRRGGEAFVSIALRPVESNVHRRGGRAPAHEGAAPPTLPLVATPEREGAQIRRGPTRGNARYRPTDRRGLRGRSRG